MYIFELTVNKMLKALAKIKKQEELNKNETVVHFKTHTNQKLIVLERAIDTTKKWNLKHVIGDKFTAF